MLDPDPYLDPHFINADPKPCSSSSSGSVDGAGAELCRVGGGGRPVMVVCRSLRKDRDGDSSVLMNLPGRITCEPNTASAVEN